MTLTEQDYQEIAKMVDFEPYNYDTDDDDEYGEFGGEIEYNKDNVSIFIEYHGTLLFSYSVNHRYGAYKDTTIEDKLLGFDIVEVNSYDDDTNEDVDVHFDEDKLISIIESYR